MMAGYSIEQLVACAKRELAQRRRVYRRLVDQQKMNQADADYEIGAMEAILENLEDQLQPPLL